MEFHLLLHNIGFVLCTVIALFFAIFVYAKDPKNVANITFALGFISIAVFTTSHVIGVNISDPLLSRNVFMWNISIIYIACFMAHCTFAVIGIDKKQKYFLWVMYVIALIFTAYFILYPDAYLLPSVPKMYFPSYYVPGYLHTLARIIFSLIVPAYFLSHLMYGLKNVDEDKKNRIKYFLISSFVGYGFGSLAIFLVYNIPVDPIYAAFSVPFLAIPMAYAIVQYQLMDIRVITKRSIIFAVAIALSSFAIFAIGNINFYINSIYPDFPSWLMPLLGGFVATGIGYIIWKKFREADLIKYEFVTTVTHKLRTPLTSIKWSAENLSSITPVAAIPDLEHIKEAANKLIELTNVITDFSSEDQENYLYKYHNIDIVDFALEVAREYDKLAQIKNIQYKTDDIETGKIMVRADKERLKTALQIIIENAINYTNSGGVVSLSMKKIKQNHIEIRVTDTGIGIDKTELKHIFTRLYRTNIARATDTEGMGIGLSIAKKIIERHRGKMGAESPGIGKGSSFYFSLPIR